MSDRKLTLLITGGIFGYIIVTGIVEYVSHTRDVAETFRKRLTFYRSQRERLIAEENCDGC